MFLKRIEAQGFKSFADKTNIIFDYNVTGIVGPNGCGKSNISDAIRWVLGEQSAKQLRGNSMADVIFNGSANRKPLNKAEVTLVFDNTNRVFPIEYDEVEFTRVLYRSGETEYQLNKQSCRLKDITNLIMDTGLGRDSLSIISQDKIQDFAKARAEDRRAIFEEAAGVAKYKKRKLESVSKLEKTQDNLNRLEDIINELDIQLGPLKRQANKAEKYREFKERLEKIEVAVIADDLVKLNETIEVIEKNINGFEETRLQSEAQISKNEAAITMKKNEMASLNAEINELHNQEGKISNDIVSLRMRKEAMDLKRQQWLEQHEEMSPERIAQMKKNCEEARLEYEDRSRRMEEYKQQEKEKLAELNEKSEMKRRADEELDACVIKINRASERRAVLDSQIKAPLQSHAQAGVKSVLDAKNSLPGIEGVIVELVKPEAGYENAVSTALGGALYNILAKDPQAATNAINFLKKNEAGRATFLPMTALQVRNLSQEVVIKASTVKGYLGLASEHASIDAKYQDVVDYLLGQVMICDKLEAANEVAKMLNYGVRVVTLDGDVVNKGGSMTGGKQRNQSTPMQLRKDFDAIVNSLTSYTIDRDSWTEQVNALGREINVINDEINRLRLDQTRLEPILDIKKEKFEKLSDELKELGEYEVSEDPDDSEDTTLIRELNEANQRNDEIKGAIKSKNEKRAALQDEIDRLDDINRELNRSQRGTLSDSKDAEVKKARLKAEWDNLAERLSSEYTLTVERAIETAEPVENILEAKQEVTLLRGQISSLGNINMEAPETYAEQKERYDNMTSTRDELMNARSQILDAISEMDKIMEKDFMETFEAINKELQGVFSELFGGGHANLYLSEPDNILESGVEIDVQPPGKAVKSMSLFSGGEKSLIALAVLFSIMRCRHVPLCILDECESALDPANVERFSRFLKKFDTQFIVVTHRPGTMEQCDYLYGVTMQDRGVTQMLHVKLSEAMQFSNKEGASA